MELVEVRYWKAKKPPTLNQFLVRKYLSEISSKIHETGTTVVDGRKLPVNAVALSDKFNNKKAEDIAKEYPQWVEEYRRLYGGKNGG